MARVAVLVLMGWWGPSVAGVPERSWDELTGQANQHEATTHPLRRENVLRSLATATTADRGCGIGLLLHCVLVRVRWTLPHPQSSGNRGGRHIISHVTMLRTIC